MKLRILTALPLGALVIWVIGWAPLWVFLLVLLAAIEIGLHEFFKVSRQNGADPFAAVAYAAGGVLCAAQAGDLGKARGLTVFVFVASFLLILTLGIVRTNNLKHYLESVSVTFLGVTYVALTLSLLLPLRFSRSVGGREQVLFLFLVIWAGDIFAYLAGRTMGKTPLMPRVSPKKTVEGAVAGLAGSLLVGWGFAHWFWKIDSRTILLWATLVAVAGQIGDLAESAMKRGAEVKDSGSLLPGHGGLLDRIDSLLFAAPVFWLALALRDLPSRFVIIR